MQAADRAAQVPMNELVGEIRNSIQYFASLPGRLPVSRLLVTGGGSELCGIINMLEGQVRLPVLAVSPLARLDTSKLDLSEEQAREVGPVLATPIGLALSEPDKSVKKFNLLPPEVAKRAKMKKLQERTTLAGAAVLIVLVLFGAWKFYQVHSAQNDVNNLNASIATLNAQVPKYDLVVAANNAYSAGVARRASVLNSAVDWPLALSNLISITPAQAKVQGFDGNAVSSVAGTTGSAATSTATPTTQPGGTTATAGSHATTSAAIGTVQLQVTGPGPSLSISEAWINAIAGSQLFANPLQGATVVNPDTTISFPFTISITPNASLDKNASLK
jgi:outer membrane murein-binding lipoprotein Lpp